MHESGSAPLPGIVEIDPDEVLDCGSIHHHSCLSSAHDHSHIGWNLKHSLIGAGFALLWFASLAPASFGSSAHSTHHPTHQEVVAMIAVSKHEYLSLVKSLKPLDSVKIWTYVCMVMPVHDLDPSMFCFRGYILVCRYHHDQHRRSWNIWIHGQPHCTCCPYG